MKQEPRGLSAKRSGLIMSILALLVSALLIVETVLAHTGYSELRNVSDHFIQWQRDASELQDGSDRLTEQVRCFVETGNRMYLTPCIATHPAPLSMVFSRQRYWTGLPFSSPEDLPDLGIEPRSWQADSLPMEL